MLKLCGCHGWGAVLAKGMTCSPRTVVPLFWAQSPVVPLVAQRPRRDNGVAWAQGSGRLWRLRRAIPNQIQMPKQILWNPPLACIFASVRWLLPALAQRLLD